VLSVPVASVCGAIVCHLDFANPESTSSYFTVIGDHLSYTSDTLSPCQVLETFSFSSSSADRLEVEKYSNLRPAFQKLWSAMGITTIFGLFPISTISPNGPKIIFTTIIFLLFRTYSFFSLKKKKQQQGKRGHVYTKHLCTLTTMDTTTLCF
jgi:hypothetical protein